MAKIRVSLPCFNEISAALEVAGYKLGENVASVTIEKGDQIEPPVSFKMVTIRRDCADIAAKAYQYSPEGTEFVAFAKELYEYIVTGEIKSASTTTEIWK